AVDHAVVDEGLQAATLHHRHRMGDQRHRRPAVLLAHQRQDLHDAGTPPHLHPLQEPHQFLAHVGAEEPGTVQEGRVLTAHGLKVLAVVPERPTLAHRRFIVDAPDASHQRLVEG
ncbi:MAG: hypothetical protein ACK559_16315, partial [bacterium]